MQHTRFYNSSTEKGFAVCACAACCAEYIQYLLNEGVKLKSEAMFTFLLRCFWRECSHLWQLPWLLLPPVCKSAYKLELSILALCQGGFARCSHSRPCTPTVNHKDEINLAAVSEREKC